MKHEITSALNNFATSDLRTAAVGLLNTLGYRSEKMLPLENTPEAFRDQFGRDDIANWEQKALFDQWQTVEFLFQITDDELSNQAGLFESNAVDTGLMRSYLFFALELKGSDYARGELTRIARQINRLFPTPVMVLIKHVENDEPVLSIAVINRRQNKRDADRDVLGKVTIIRNISLAQPHRGHLDILASFATDNLVHPQRLPISSFDALHAAWEEVFNVELLNKKFYRELSNWYFWAMQKVRFPYDELKENADKLDKDGLFKDEEKIKEHDAKNLIRLLTRLLFVWFIKEKHLVPEKIFEQSELQRNILKDFDPRSKDTRYYKAILQNLFFATLNQTRGKREFRKPGQHRNTTTLMRYEDHFQNPSTFIDLLESVVPFMNGGLFECLDKPHPEKKGPQGGDVILYEDGFSDRADNILAVPDELFFAGERQIDLSDIYGDKKRRSEKVRGIIPILNSYKFTIVENTPIDQEIALDPELLGKVFENLLASYNPETKTTARKQTGSFYTPRTIVDYMVDESLIAYLAGKLDAADQSDQQAPRLRQLFSYTDEPHEFSEAEVMGLIEAIDKCKILDPACGSGAFPMGILHKLELILAKLDPQNRLWRDRQIEKVDATIAAAEQIDDARVRENSIRELEAQKRDIEDAFANNELGYGRKLYLIENCIYGVDIQSIATQVSKLRFFISLIVDQRVHPEQENFGIRALPNLETKFATANTLIQVEKPEQQLSLFDSAKVKDLERELKKVRHEIFSAKTPKTKGKYRESDKELREQIAAELQAHGLGNDTARQLAQWDPYDQNASAAFFDPEWMFDVQGFDIVIGNPPYIQIQKFPQKQKVLWKQQKYQTYAATADIYCLFYERGVRLLNPGGHLFYITSNKWMRAGYGKSLRAFFLNQNPRLLVDLGPGIFKSAAVDTCILIMQKPETPPARLCLDAVTLKDEANEVGISSYIKAHRTRLAKLSENAWFIGSASEQRLKDKIESVCKPLKDWDVNIYRGVLTGLNEAFIIDTPTKDRLCAEDPKSAEILKPILRGRDISRYGYKWGGLWVIASGFDVDVPEKYPAVFRHLEQFEEKAKRRDDKGRNWWNLRACKYYPEFEKEKVVWARLMRIHKSTDVSFPRFCFADPRTYVVDSLCFISGRHLKYIVAFMNSKYGEKYFRENIAILDNGGMQMRQQYVENFPIPPITRSNQPFVSQIETVIDRILAKKKENLQADTKGLELEIDQLVYTLYGLTEQEIVVVEGETQQ